MKHGNTGNNHASKPDEEKISQARIQLAMTKEMKRQCEKAAKKEGVKIVAWLRSVVADRLENDPP